MRIIIFLLLLSLNGFGQTAEIPNPEKVKNYSSKKQFRTVCAATYKESNQLLFILDGKIIDEEEARNIKSETIESINILKADSTTFFCHGRNDVIVITTKKRSKKELRELKNKDNKS